MEPECPSYAILFAPPIARIIDEKTASVEDRHTTGSIRRSFAAGNNRRRPSTAFCGSAHGKSNASRKGNHVQEYASITEEPCSPVSRGRGFELPCHMGCVHDRRFPAGKCAGAPEFVWLGYLALSRGTPHTKPGKDALRHR